MQVVEAIENNPALLAETGLSGRTRAIPVVVPQVNVAAEQYNGIVRLVLRGIPVQLEVNIAVRPRRRGRERQQSKQRLFMS
jgi:hypothetical protein